MHERRAKSQELLQEVDGIGAERSGELLSELGSGREVAQASASAWGRVASVDGISSDTAREMFQRMRDAGVYEDLRNARHNPGQAQMPQRGGDSALFTQPATRPTDIGRTPAGRYDRPDSRPDVRPAPVARDTRSGRFGLDPFDITSGGTGESVELFDPDASAFDVEDPDTLADVFRTGWDENTPDDDRGVLDEAGVDFETFGREVEAREERFAGALDTAGATMQVIEDARRENPESVFDGDRR